MSRKIADASIFRASAMDTTPGSSMAEGFHFRVKVSPWIGFPFHPFAAWRLDITHVLESLRRNEDQHRVPVVWRDAGGRAQASPFDIENVGGQAVGIIVDAQRDDPWIWVELEVDDRNMRVDILGDRIAADDEWPILATRRKGPFRFGSTEIAALRVSGAGTVLAIRGIRVSDLFLDEYPRRPADFTFGLPRYQGPWYVPDPRFDPYDAADRRVRVAAPRWLSPPDNPTGSVLPPLNTNEEADRIMDAIGPELVEPWLAKAFDDAHVAPVDAVFSETSSTATGAALETNAKAIPSLLTMAVDPQIARYLGLATLQEFGETAPSEPANIWLIASRWAVRAQRPILQLGGISIPLRTFLETALEVPGWVIESLNQEFPDAESQIAAFSEIHVEGSSAWSAIPQMTLAVAAGDAPPDPPDPFTLSAAEKGRWNAHDAPENPGPESWRQSISLGGQPARGMVGFARMAPGEPVALHRTAPEPGSGYVVRVLPLVPNWAGSNRRLVTDREIPPDPAGASWQVWQADEFGQWSDGASLSLPLPARPAPPPPVIEVTYSANPDDGSTGLRIPGEMHLRCAVPATTHAAPGSRPIIGLRISADGVEVVQTAVAAGDVIVRDIALPTSFSVGQKRTVLIESFFTDDAGTGSAIAEVPCDAFDARAPRPIPTSPVVIWTGYPDATGLAELALKWPPIEGAARYRIYMGDARRLAAAAGIALPGGHVRSMQAKPLHDASGALVDKQSFTFLGEVPGTPEGDGRLHFKTQIPGTLRSLQFVRIVPLTFGGAEAVFSHCGLVPVAVPSLDRPPPPILDAAMDPALGLTLTIRALGLRAELLEAAPGGVPEYRLRRTRNAATDRFYAPVWKKGSLKGPDGDGQWTATLSVPAAELDPFVRTTWLAEIRYPAEPPIPPGFSPLPVTGGVEPAWTNIGNAAEAIWSDPSLAAESLFVPPEGPRAPVAPVLTEGADGSVTLAMTGLPVAHPAAATPYRLEIYRTPATMPVQTPVETILSDALIWTDPAPQAGAQYDLVVIDPIGRRSLPVRA